MKGFPPLHDVASIGPTAQAAWVRAQPLRDLVPRVFPTDPFCAAEIADSTRGAFSPYGGEGPRWTLLRLQSNGSFSNIVLPNAIRFDALTLEPGPDGGPKLLVHFDTDRGRITGALPEFFSGWPQPFPPADDAEYEAAFLRLTGQYTPPPDPPEIAAFETRHLGRLEPDIYGFSGAALDVPALSAKPMEVSLDFFGPDDAGAIDAALDVFLGDLDGHLARATDAVVKNMRAFAMAAYRDPDGSPLTGYKRDDKFEAALAIKEPSQIWTHVQPYALHLVREGYPDTPPAMQVMTEGPIYLVMHAHCDWEIEHGLGVVWREGTTLTAVGASDVHVGDAM